MRPGAIGSVACLTLFLAAVPAESAGPDYGPLGRSVYSLSDDFRHLRLGLRDPGLGERLAEKRREVLDHTRAHRDSPLTMLQWGHPFIAVYNWSDTFDWSTQAESEAGLREALAALQTLEGSNVIAAADVAATIIPFHADRWMSADAPACVRLLDDTEQWLRTLGAWTRRPVREPRRADDEQMVILPHSAVPNAWLYRTGHVQAGLLNHEDQFDAAGRERLWQSRQARLRRIVEADYLSMPHRNAIIAHWAEVLLANGRGAEADRLLRWWLQRHDGRILSARYYLAFMRVLILENTDMAAAGRLFDHVNALAHEFGGSADREYHDRLQRFYFAHLLPPDYELRRRRHLRLEAWRERLAAADQQRAERAAAP